MGRSWRSTTMRRPPPPDPGDPPPGAPPSARSKESATTRRPLPPSLPDPPSLSTWIADPAVSPPDPAVPAICGGGVERDLRRASDRDWDRARLPRPPQRLEPPPNPLDSRRHRRRRHRPHRSE
ncbi:hypothetical protein GN958_ATG07125 [Phytophthora infestans]|uniref:Uncharacterized protein n=1 Tax=Phytophthora infestans TaxID=4787 RepID=A0A8S9URV2_PHYIN|nr:hypothetical protein GN958_ATG07125 [Phytophthora infestans]